MIVPKLISSEVVKEKFYSSTGIQIELGEDDFRLWVAEAYDLLSLPTLLMKKVIGHKQDSSYDFKNYSVELPCDFKALVPSGLSVDGQPVRWNQNSFHYLLGGECCDLDTLNNSSLDIFIDQFGNEFSPQASVSPNLAPLYRDVTFDIYDNKITFNIKEGKLCMSYWALPLDQKGYLMIPDNEKFKRFLTDYIIWKNDYILWRQQSLSDKMYLKSEENKNWSLSSAASSIKLPDVEQLQSMKDSIIRLLPHSTSYYHFFKNLGTPENRRFR